MGAGCSSSGKAPDVSDPATSKPAADAKATVAAKVQEEAAVKCGPYGEFPPFQAQFFVLQHRGGGPDITCAHDGYAFFETREQAQPVYQKWVGSPFATILLDRDFNILDSYGLDITKDVRGAFFDRFMELKGPFFVIRHMAEDLTKDQTCEGKKFDSFAAAMVEFDQHVGGDRPVILCDSGFAEFGYSGNRDREVKLDFRKWWSTQGGIGRCVIDSDEVRLIDDGVPPENFKYETEVDGNGTEGAVWNVMERNGLYLRWGPSFEENWLGISLKGSLSKWDGYRLTFEIEMFDRNGEKIASADSGCCGGAAVEGMRTSGSSVGTFQCDSMKEKAASGYTLKIKVSASG